MVDPHAALRQRILAAPDDPDAWMVLADALQADDDPRGRLIALQAALENRDDDALVATERRWRFRHQRALMGALASYDRPWFVDWRWGFPTALEMVVDRETGPACHILASLDLLALRELRLVGTTNYSRLMRVFLSREWPLLWSLELGPLAMGAGQLDVPVGEILSAVPELLNLRVEFPTVLGELSHPKLDSLAMSLHREQLETLDLRGLTALTELTLFAHHPIEAAVLHRELPPTVSSVTLYGTEPPPSIEGVRIRTGTRPDASRDRLLTSPDQVRERRFHLRGQFWAIRRRNNSLYERTGRLDRPGRSERTGFHDAYQASRQYSKLVATRLQEGYVEVFPEPPHEPRL